jgi:hypothetical protein
MKNISNNSRKPNMGFLIPGVVFVAVYFVNYDSVWIIIGICFIIFSFDSKP